MQWRDCFRRCDRSQLTICKTDARYLLRKLNFSGDESLRLLYFTQKRNRGIWDRVCLLSKMGSAVIAHEN